MQMQNQVPPLSCSVQIKKGGVEKGRRRGDIALKGAYS